MASVKLLKERRRPCSSARAHTFCSLPSSPNSAIDRMHRWQIASTKSSMPNYRSKGWPRAHLRRRYVSAPSNARFDWPQSTASEVVSFLQSDSAKKRDELVDRLLQSPTCAVHLASIWSSWLLPEMQEVTGPGGAQWLAKLAAQSLC